jgi:bacterioferritin
MEVPVMQDPDPNLPEGFHDPSPYPEITASEPNICYSRLLLDDYAGTVSEMTLISQYRYHEVMTGETRVRDVLNGIAAVEMRHISLLAELIMKLGGEPLYRNGSGIYWNPKAIYYGSGLRDRIRADIDVEQRAVSCYELHIEMIDDPEVKNILSRVILDEELHIRLLKDISREYEIP